MEQMTVEVDDFASDDPWPAASKSEKLNMTAVTLLFDNLEDPRGDIFYIYFYITTEYRWITFRTDGRVEVLRRLLRIFSEIPELRIVSISKGLER